MKDADADAFRGLPQRTPAQELADARALWAVRVLWKHALHHGTRHSFGVSMSLTGGLHTTSSVNVGATERTGVSIHDEDAVSIEAGLEAMLAAAQAVFPTLSADVRAKLGECP